MIKQIKIVHGYELWITFRDEFEVEHNFWGRVYKNPSTSSMDRLAEILPKHCDVALERDGLSFVLIFNRRINSLNGVIPEKP